MRSSAPRVVVFLAAAWMCYTVPDAFARTEFGDIAVIPELTPSGTSFHGYAEYRVAVSNRSPDKTHRITLTLPDNTYNFSRYRIRKITRSVVVGPSATVNVTLLQPPVKLHGNGLGVAIDGDAQDETVQLSVVEHGANTLDKWQIRHMSSTMPPGMPPGMRRRALLHSPQFRILASRDVDTTDLHVHANNLLSSYASGGSAPYETINLGLPVSAWSTSWLGFSRYDGIIVTGDNVRQMPPEVQSALWRYVECGGALLVLGRRELPQSWELEIASDSAEFVNYDTGFGQCIVTAEMDTKRLTLEQWRQIVHSWRNTRTPWQNGRSVEDANTAFPVVSDLGVPVRGMFLLMLIFAVAIGPLNLIALSRKRRRIWMLWTTPIVSLITCLTVFAYATFDEGWKRHVRTEGLTLLDERTQRATTIGWTAYYSSLTPGDGLHFGYETELTPQIVLESGMPRTLDWTHDQHLANGWVTARVPAHFMLRKSELRRERVTIRRGGGAGLKVVNGLGADINQFWLVDMDGAIYSTTGIPAGTEMELTPEKQLRLGETLMFDVWDAYIDPELGQSNTPPILGSALKWRSTLRSEDATIEGQRRGQQWLVPSEIWGQRYLPNQTEKRGTLRIHDEGTPSLRSVFASPQWILAFQDIRTNPQKYLRPGSYIAFLDAAPFIEEGLQKATDKHFRCIVYGIMAGE